MTNDDRKATRRRQGQADAKAFAKVAPMMQLNIATAVGDFTKSYVTKSLELVDAFLGDDDESPEESFFNLARLAIGHWSRTMQAMAGMLPSRRQKVGPPQSSVGFDIDQYSQATDPIPILVDAATRDAIANDQLAVVDLQGDGITIPGENIRLSVDGENAFISLVGLGGLELQAPRTLQGVITVRSKKLGYAPARKLVDIEVQVTHNPQQPG